MPVVSRRSATGSVCAVAILGALVVASCGTSDAGSSGSGRKTMTGVVTALQPKLCVGRPRATGQCFTATDGERVSVSVDDCVTVTYTADGDQQFTAINVARTDSRSCSS